MKPPIEMTWNQIEHQAQQQVAKQTKRAAEMLEEFLESDISMLDYRDLCFYAEEVGMKVDALRKLHPGSILNENVLSTYYLDPTDDILNIY